MISVKKPIILKLLCRIALPLFIIYLFIIIFTYHQNKQNALKNTEAYLSELVKHNAQRLDKEFSELAHSSRVIKSYIETTYPTDFEEIYDFIDDEVRFDGNNVGSGFAFLPYKYDKKLETVAYFVGKKGGLTVVSDLSKVYNYLEEDWFLIPQKLKKSYWTEPFWGRVTEDILVINTTPIEFDNQVVGVSFADMSLQMIDSIMLKNEVLNGYSFILSGLGTFVYHPKSDWVMRETVFSIAEMYNRPDVRELGKRMISFHKDGNEYESQIETFNDFDTNEKKWIVYTSIPSNGWTFAAVINEKDVLAQVYKVAYIQLAIMIVGLLILLTIILIVSKSFSGRIKKLASLTNEVASGNLELCHSEFDLMDSGKDEITALGGNFYKMINDLKLYINNLTQITKQKEAVESEVRIARQIQESLLPHIFPPFPHRKEFDLYAVNIPAKEVAGDFYDFFFVDDYTIAVIMADVSGKGVAAGLFMAITKTLIKTLCVPGSNPEQALTDVNNILCKDNDSCMFTTLFLAYFDVRTNEFHYSNAGHCYPLLISKDGICKEVVTKQDVALGIFEKYEFQGDSFKLEKDDIVVLYTDGVTEAINSKEEMFGEERFKNIVVKNYKDKLNSIIAKVTDELDIFQGNEQFDDITLLMFKRVM